MTLADEQSCNCMQKSSSMLMLCRSCRIHLSFFSGN